MELSWLDPTRLDDRDVTAVAALREAAREVDMPYDQPMTTRAWSAELRHGWDDVPAATALSRDHRGRVIGVLRVMSPEWDNRHLATVQVTVDPQHRRRGLGRELFHAGLARVRAQGRRVVTATCVADSAGAAFLKTMDLAPAFTEAVRRLDVAALDWQRIDALAAAAEPYAVNYDLQRVSLPVPDQIVAEVAALTAAINDAPTGDLDIENAVFPPERIRAYEQSQLAAGRRVYRLVARHRDTGVLAGHTVAAVDPDLPWWVAQHDTSVVRAHRGHRLGLLLKIEMLRWLREREPQTRLMITGNAADNTHMIGVNEALGYRLVGELVEFQRAL